MRHILELRRLENDKYIKAQQEYWSQQEQAVHSAALVMIQNILEEARQKRKSLDLKEKQDQCLKQQQLAHVEAMKIVEKFLLEAKERQLQQVQESMRIEKEKQLEFLHNQVKILAQEVTFCTIKVALIDSVEQIRRALDIYHRRREAAAGSIQRHTRGYLSRKRTNVLLSDKRRLQKEMEILKIMENRNKAAIQIQSVYRGHRGRAKAKAAKGKKKRDKEILLTREYRLPSPKGIPKPRKESFVKLSCIKKVNQLGLPIIPDAKTLAAQHRPKVVPAQGKPFQFRRRLQLVAEQVGVEYSPSTEDMTEMAMYLGLDFKLDISLRDKVIAACIAPLPDNFQWTPFVNEEGHVFVESPDKSSATWELPSDTYYYKLVRKLCPEVEKRKYFFT